MGETPSTTGMDGRFQDSWQLQHHALRQPLNALGLFCAALKQQPLSPAQRPLVDGIAEAAVSIERLVDEHFAVLRASAGENGSTVPEQPANAPMSAPPPLSAAPLAGPGVPGASPPQGLPGVPRIVVVDDDDAARTGLALLLEGCGAAVQPFAGIDMLGRWLQQSRDAPPDLLIMDYHLPRPGDGLQALRLVREAWPGRPVPALLITGDERAAVSNALTDGSMECLIKPVKPAPLVAALRKHLGQRIGASLRMQ